MSRVYDLVIAGGGAAGLTAAVYAVRSGLDFLLVDSSASMGSQIAQTDEVDNYTGIDSITGIELVQRFYDHANKLNAPMKNDTIKKITKQNGLFSVECEGQALLAKSVIFCAGAGHRKLGIKGENEFTGRGVGYCAVCDGFFYRNKTVVVVGGGNTAVTEAIYLSKICKKVYLVHRRDTLRAERALTEKLESTDNIEILYSSELNQICGGNSVSSVILKNGEELECQGVFIAVGIVPRSEAIKDIADTDEYGFVLASESGETSCKGLFAAGDVRTKSLRQIITACSDGANCIDSVNKFLNEGAQK